MIWLVEFHPSPLTPNAFTVIKSDMWSAKLFLTLVQWLGLRFFNFTMVRKLCTFNRSCTSIFEFWSLPGLAMGGVILPRDAGQRQQTQLPVSHATMKINNQYTYNRSVLIQPVCFSLSIQHSINYMRHPTFPYKIGFVWDEFAQL